MLICAISYRDKERTVANYSSFCGQGVKVSDGSSSIENSCHIQTNVNGYDIEACFCDKDRCNASNNLTRNLSLIILLTILSTFAAL